MERFAAARSLLFVPGDDPRKLARAWKSSADGVIVDLEDAVLPDRKDLARKLVVDSLPASGPAPLRVVRVNGTDTVWGLDDLAALDGAPVDAIMMPKATTHSLDRMPDGDVPVIALVETAVGLRQAYDIANHPRVHALALGAADLGAELRWQPRPDGLELLHARSTLVLDSAAAGIRPPFDAVYLDTRDTAGLKREADVARSLGLGGKACIHPAQVDVVNEVFSPSEQEIRAAQEVLDAFDAAVADGASAVTVVRGRLVDAPVAAQARIVWRTAEVLSLASIRMRHSEEGTR
jgi:citrate lyase beta subunit